jgi:hypothetical protein
MVKAYFSFEQLKDAIDFDSIVMIAMNQELFHTFNI